MSAVRKREGERIIPFLKWAGGKRWFTENHLKLLPRTIDRYFEPFVGSASVYFALRPSSAVLSDTNEELIITYRAIKDNPNLVLRYLRAHAANHSDWYYYEVRNSKPKSNASRAARLLYLNRTCWNGLYRVNKRGKFNVPRGTKNSVIFDTDDFHAISKELRNADLLHEDFEVVLSDAKSGDFAFIDPPYTVKHNLNGFRKYNDKIFSWDDQVRLARICRQLSERNCRFLMTNANHESILDLYRDDFEVLAVQRKSVLAANSQFRTEVSELVIKNY